MTVGAEVNESNQEIIVGSTQKVNQDEEEPKGALLQADGLVITTRSGVVLLSDIAFHIAPGELVTVTGPSNSGKTVLLNCLASLIKPSSGSVMVNGVNLYTNLKAFRPAIGYVSSEFAFQPYMTVIEIMRVAARLRSPGSTPRPEIQEKVLSIAELTGITNLANRKVDSLSKLDRRRLCIAVELMGAPGLLLLDESSELLTSAEKFRITQLLRELSYHGITIIQVSDFSRSIMESDKALYLAVGGFLAWFGPPSEALPFFRMMGSSGNENNPFGQDEALLLLSDPTLLDGPSWAKKFKANPAYERYIDDPLNNRYPDLLLQSQPLLRLRSNLKEKLPPSLVRRANGFQKFFLLIARNSHLLWRSKTTWLMLAFPPLIALIDFALSTPTMLDPQLGDPYRAPIVYGLLIFLDLLVAALLVHHEIFKEKMVYRREMRATPMVFPYIFSKIWLVALLSIYQGFVWTFIHFIATGMHAGVLVLLPNLVTFCLIAFIGGLIGLIASAISRTAIATTGLVFLLTVPQLLLGEAIVPITHLNFPFGLLSWLNPSRYAFETLLTTSGYGQAIISDACWQLPADQRSALTDDQKSSCTCMGINIFSACRFPGIQSFYSYIIEQPEPLQPTPGSAINNIPVQPLLKPGETAAQYQAEVSSYTSQLEIYQGNYDQFVSSLRQFSTNLSNWQRGRSLIIGNAEGIISVAIDHYGEAFNVNLVNNWTILALMILLMIVLLIGVQRGVRVVKL